MAYQGRFFGWRVVWSAFALAMFGWGVGFYGPPVYLHTVIERTGWPLSLVSMAVTVHFLIGAIVIANLPALSRSYGVSRVTSAGALILAAGVIGWAVATTPSQLLATAILSGVGWVAMGAAAVNAIVAPWFERARPAALATAYNGASIGGLLFTALWVALIGRVGFVAAATAMGTVMLIPICTGRPMKRLVKRVTPVPRRMVSVSQSTIDTSSSPSRVGSPMTSISVILRFAIVKRSALTNRPRGATTMPMAPFTSAGCVSRARCP
jgi:MFS family permease